ncbi:MAG: tripartite tricarboxylate transporter substrate binding protein [Deltaproteobacteria bacterium]|nr:tripartite tricarboxylate transporter substrate binding protein [Deltaproteobacteria bacterium]
MMKTGKWFVLAIAGVLLLTMQGISEDQAMAAAYPDRPITLLVGFTPGGSVDLSARALANAVKKIIGRPVVIENKPGGTGTVALAAMLAQNPDGYTLCATPSSVLIRVPQMQKVPFKPLKNFKPLIGYATPQLAIVVRSDAPWKSLKDLVNDAAKHAGNIKYATTGVGSTTHAAVEEIAAKEKIQMIHVPYKGGSEALTALLGGHVDFASLTAEFIPSLKAGQTRLLATMNEKRSPQFSGTPTLKEIGYDFVNDAVFSIVCPSNLPPAVREKLEKVFAQATQDKEYRETLEKIDLIPVSYDGKRLEGFLKSNWEKINRHLIATGLIKEAATLPE